MFSGLSYAVGEIAVLLVIAAVLGAVVGHVVWRARSREQAGDAGQSETDAVKEVTHRLTAARAEIDELRAEIVAVSNRKDTEMGRLESGAIQALDSTIASHQARITALEADVAAQQQIAQDAMGRLADEQRRTDRLQTALTQRGERIAELAAEIEARDRRSARSRHGPARPR